VTTVPFGSRRPDTASACLLGRAGLTIFISRFPPRFGLHAFDEYVNASSAHSERTTQLSSLQMKHFPRAVDMVSVIATLVTAMTTRELIRRCTQDPAQACDLILLEAHIHKEHSLRSASRNHFRRWLLIVLLAMLVLCLLLIGAVSAHLLNCSECEIERRYPDENS
jgi:hypothetical protein